MEWMEKAERERKKKRGNGDGKGRDGRGRAKREGGVQSQRKQLRGFRLTPTSAELGLEALVVSLVLDDLDVSHGWLMEESGPLRSRLVSVSLSHTSNSAKPEIPKHRTPFQPS